MSEWFPAEATIEIAGRLTNIKAPSKVQLRGGLNHLCHESLTSFVRGAETVKEINYVVDVGANMGATALMFHTAFPNARVLALEPMPMNWDCLIHNTKDFPAIECLKMAAGRERGYIDLALPDKEQRPDIDSDLEGNSGLFSMFGNGPRRESVKANKLDDIVNGKVDLLKIDVEGAEAEVLAGATRIMDEDRPIMFIEIRQANMDMAGHTLDDFDQYFKWLKYKRLGDYLEDYIMCPFELDHRTWSQVVAKINTGGRVECESRQQQTLTTSSPY